jgi:hypothetical protein
MTFEDYNYDFSNKYILVDETGQGVKELDDADKKAYLDDVLCQKVRGEFEHNLL